MEESSVGTLINEIVNVTMPGNVIEEVLLGDQFLPFLDSSGSLVFKGVIELNGSVYFDTSQFANYVIEQQQQITEDEQNQDQQMHNDRIIQCVGEKSMDLKHCGNHSIHMNDTYLRGPSSPVSPTLSCPTSYTTTTSTFVKDFQDISTGPSSRPISVTTTTTASNGSRLVEFQHHLQSEEEQLVPVPEIDSMTTSSRDPLEHEYSRGTINNILEPPVGRGPYRCGICNRVFSKWPQMRRHKKEHLDEKVFRCEKCPMTFNYENNLSVHLLVHEAETTGCLRCKLCNSKFSRLASLKSHLRVHEKEDNLVCQECGDEFPTKARLENHMDEHKPKNPQVCLLHRCKLCGKTFAQAALLKDHSKEHAAIRSQLKSLNTRKRKMKPKSALRDNGNSTEISVIATTTTTTTSSNESNISKVDRKKKRICTVCNKRFQKPSQLARHERIHTGEKPFECKECGKRFNQKGTMESHIQAMHKREKPYGCDLCNCKFSQRGNLKAHVLKVHVPPADNEKVFRCEECCCVYRRLATLNNHIAKVHAVESTQTEEDIIRGAGLDDEASESVLITSDLFPKRSLQNVHNSKRSTANISTTTIVSQEQLSSHPNLQQQQDVSIVNSVGINGKQNSTTVDGRNVLVDSLQEISSNIRTETHGSLSEINIVHTEQGKAMRSLVKVKKVGQVKWHLCPYCQKAFRKPSDLIRHIRVHTQERPYTCNICGKAFAVKSTLNTHVRTHCPNKELECRVCHKRFSMLSSLKSHERLHTRVKPYPCLQCGKSFRTSSQRRVHYKIHSRNLQGLNGKRKLLRIGETSTPPIELPDPLKITSDGLVPVPNRSASAMTSKEQSEGKFRPYKCKECPSAFKKSSHLKQHIRSHTGEKPYKCFQCFRSFVSSGVLKNHIKTHEKVRAFKCSVCTMSFTTNGSLTRHMSTVHIPNRPYVCPYCHKTFKTSVSCRKHIKTHRTEIVASISGSGGLTTEVQEEEETEQVISLDTDNNSSTTIHTGQNELFDDNCQFDGGSTEGHYEDYASTVAAVLSEDMNQSNVSLIHNGHVIEGIQDTSSSHHHQQLSIIPIQQHQHGQQVSINDSLSTLSRPPLNNMMQTILHTSTISHDLTGDNDSSSVQLHYQIPCSTTMHSQQQDPHSLPHHQQHHQITTTIIEQQHHDPNGNYTTVYGLQEGENVDSSLVPYLSEDQNTGVLSGDQMQTQELSSYQYSTSTVEDELVHHTQSPPQQQQDIVTEIQNNLENQVEATTQVVVIDQVNNTVSTIPTITITTSNNNSTTSVRNENQEGNVTEEVQRIRETSRPISEKIYNELTTQPHTSFRHEDIRLASKMNECQFCLRAFKKRSDLQRHVRIHTGEKPFKCNVCTKSFRVKSTREAHMRTHGGGKSVSCHVCNNLFSTKSSLRVHMRLHTGAKPYPCQFCDLSFRTSGHRKAHVASHFKKDSNVNNNNRTTTTASASVNTTTTLCTSEQSSTTPTTTTQYLLSDIVAIHSTASPQDSSIPVPVVISNDNNNMTTTTTNNTNNSGQLLPSMIHTLTKDKHLMPTYSSSTPSSSKSSNHHQEEELDIAAIAAACENMTNSQDSLHVIGNVQLTMDGQTIQLTGLDLSSLQVDENFIQNLANVIFIPPPQNSTTTNNNNSSPDTSSTQIIHHDHYDGGRINVVDMNGTLSQISVGDVGGGSFSEVLTGKDVNVGGPVNIASSQHQEEHDVSSSVEIDTLTSSINSVTVPSNHHHHHEQILSSSSQQDELDQYITGDSLSSVPPPPPSSSSQSQKPKGKRKMVTTGLKSSRTKIIRTTTTLPTNNKCCTECGKIFSKPSLLSRHMRIHTGEKPYQCNLCDRSFSQQTSLSAHLFTHTNEKPFVCFLCPFKTVKKGALKKHFSKAHPKNMEQFEIMFTKNAVIQIK